MTNNANRNNVEYPDILDTPEVQSLFAQAMGCPTKEKIQAAINSYKHDNGYIHTLYEPVELKCRGVIAIEIFKKKAIIGHIAVVESHRYQGYGRKLINILLKEHPQIRIFEAETDEDAVEFYQKCGFQCQEIQGKYGDRYTCTLKVPPCP